MSLPLVSSATARELAGSWYPPPRTVPTRRPVLLPSSTTPLPTLSPSWLQVSSHLQITHLLSHQVVSIDKSPNHSKHDTLNNLILLILYVYVCMHVCTRSDLAMKEDTSCMNKMYYAPCESVKLSIIL